MIKVTTIVFNNFKHDSRVLKTGMTLLRHGYDVTVVAMHDGDLPIEETVQGLKVHRLPLKTRQWSKNRFIQLFKYGEFFYRLVKGHRKSDIFHCNDVAPLPLAILIKWFFNRKAKVIYDAHELEFDKKEASSNYYPQRIISFAEKTFIKNADAMLTVSPLIAKAYVERYKIESPKIVMNCPPYLRDIPQADLFRKKFGIAPEQKIFLYQGGLIAKRGVEILLEVFKTLDENFILVFMGYGTLVDLVKTAAAQYPNIYYHEAVSPMELPKYTASADVGCVLLQGSSGNHNLTIGNKIFEYIMAGLPVLAADLAGLRYVLNEHTGIVVKNHHEPVAVKDAVLKIAQWDKKVSLPYLRDAAKSYNWEAQEQVLLDTYKKLHG